VCNGVRCCRSRSFTGPTFPLLHMLGTAVESAKGPGIVDEWMEDESVCCLSTWSIGRLVPHAH